MSELFVYGRRQQALLNVLSPVHSLSPLSLGSGWLAAVGFFGTSVGAAVVMLVPAILFSLSALVMAVTIVKVSPLVCLHPKTSTSHKECPMSSAAGCDGESCFLGIHRVCGGHMALFLGVHTSDPRGGQECPGTNSLGTGAFPVKRAEAPPGQPG